MSAGVAQDVITIRGVEYTQAAHGDHYYVNNTNVMETSFKTKWYNDLDSFIPYALPGPFEEIIGEDGKVWMQSHRFPVISVVSVEDTPSPAMRTAIILQMLAAGVDALSKYSLIYQECGKFGGDLYWYSDNDAQSNDTRLLILDAEKLFKETPVDALMTVRLSHLGRGIEYINQNVTYIPGCAKQFVDIRHNIRNEKNPNIQAKMLIALADALVAEGEKRDVQKQTTTLVNWAEWGDKVRNGLNKLGLARTY